MNKKTFIKNTLKESVNISAIYTIHYFKYGRNFRFETESHDFWELVFIDSGTAKILNEDTTHTLNQGQAFLHRPNVLHTILTEEQFSNSAIITFDCKNRILKSLADIVLEFNDFEKSLLNKIISEAKLTYVDKLNDVHLTTMTKRDNAPFASDQVIKNCIELLFVSLLRKTSLNTEFKDEMHININSNQIVNGIYKILSEKLDESENINLDEISYKLGFSKSYIKSQFKKRTGYSIIQYYINMKIDKAKKLLSQQKFTVSEISDILGFSSVFYFSRQFKLYTDMSPTEYVNSIKADNVL